MQNAIADNPNTADLQNKPWSAVYWIEGYTMTKDQQQAMYNDVYAPIDEHNRLVKRSNDRLMKVILNIKGKAYHTNLKNLLSEMVESHMLDSAYFLTRKPTGTFQSENWGREIKGVYVDQWAVGCEGDSFEGYMYVEVKPGRFLGVKYSC